ncbi:sedoheptulokinase-like [Haliotis rubra]|uniref:sedoheptulokinase-like n=1 Tax=Haliotis rubra TaxID=36100 RepID=UPI001EE5D740|nr:sedoheptulokinase-like [Haliotis rubra]XP_046564657.1 sedoheptulokinase-like [Haliotis rubra]
MSEKQPYALGIDIGTTSVKVSVLDIVSQETVCSTSQKSAAETVSDVGHLGFEQDPNKILQALSECITKIPASAKKQVVGIGVTGQMHGLMLWKSEEVTEATDLNTEVVTSPLYTWMDQRCTPDFLATLPAPSSHLQLATGHGCATLFWLTRHKGEVITDRGYNCSGSVMDYVVARLCGLKNPVTSVQVAASMGYFNTVQSSWNTDILSENGFPTDLLAKVVPAGAVAGQLQHPWLGILPHIPVYAALGDVQCAFLSILQDPADAVLNLSTSIQMGYVVKGDNSVRSDCLKEKPCTLDYFPYFGDEYLALSAGLNGGNVLQHFMSMLQGWCSEFGFALSEADMWAKLNDTALKSERSSLSITPTLYGERHQPSLKASITGITSSNTSLGEVYRGLCDSIIDNLHTLMPAQFLTELGHVKRILASGSVITNNPIVQSRLELVYKGIPIVYGQSGDSAIGAAKIVKH